MAKKRRKPLRRFNRVGSNRHLRLSRGRGFGTLIKSVARFLLPAAKSIGKKAARRTLKTTGRALSSAIFNPNKSLRKEVAPIAKKAGKEFVSSLKKDLSQAIVGKTTTATRTKSKAKKKRNAKKVKRKNVKFRVKY